MSKHSFSQILAKTKQSETKMVQLDLRDGESLQMVDVLRTIPVTHFQLGGS